MARRCVHFHDSDRTPEDIYGFMMLWFDTSTGKANFTEVGYRDYTFPKFLGRRFGIGQCVDRRSNIVAADTRQDVFLNICHSNYPNAEF
jgi:hypothetical protein